MQLPSLLHVTVRQNSLKPLLVHLLAFRELGYVALITQIIPVGYWPCKPFVFCQWILAFALLSSGCSFQNEGSVRFTVEDLAVSSDGTIGIHISHTGKGSIAFKKWLKKDGQNFCLGSTKGIGKGKGEGNSFLEFKASDASTVNFLVSKGEVFVLKPGMEKVLIEFLPEGDPKSSHNLCQVVFEVVPPGSPLNTYERSEPGAQAPSGP